MGDFLSRVKFCRLIKSGQTVMEAWEGSFGSRYTDEKFAREMEDASFEELVRSSRDEIERNGMDKREVFGELDRLQNLAEGFLGEKGLEAVKVAHKIVESKARVAKHLGSEVELQQKINIAVISDEGMKRIIEERRRLMVPEGGGAEASPPSPDSAPPFPASSPPDAGTGGVIEADFETITP